MKKILNFIRSKKWKRIIWILSIFLIVWFVLFSNNAYAEDIADEASLRDFLNLILKLIYLLVHLCVVLAWRLLDNSMVYWAVFHLDAPLRKFRNIMKNFANFILWFLVLLSIIQSIFTLEWHKKPFEIIKQTLIAGILIQASRFLIAAVIDISTIATYAVGWIPLNVMKSTNLWEKKVLWVNWTMNLNDIIDWNYEDKNTNDFTIFYTYWDKVIWKCKIDPTIHSIIWIQNFDSINAKMDEKDLKNKIFVDDICALYWSTVVQFTPLVEFNDGSKKWKIDTIWWTTPITDWLYDSEVDSAKGNTKNSATIEANDYNTDKKMCTMMTNWNSSISDWMTIWSLLKKNNWFQWPLSALYYSLLDFGSISDVAVSSWVKDMLAELIIKVIVAGALFLPLILLVAVLFVRIWYLRVIISFSPIYILKRIKKDFKLPILWDTHDTLEAALKAIFSPVITVFAISISLIFLSALIGTSNNPCDPTKDLSNQEKMLQAFDLTKTTTSDGAEEIEILDWMSVISFKMSDNRSIWWVLDMFSRLLINIFGIAIVWTILFAAVKANKLADVVSSKLFDVQKLWADFIKNVPIIPLWGGQRIWASSLMTTLWSQPAQIANSMNSQSTSNLNDFLNIWTSKDEKFSIWAPNSNAKNVTDISNNEASINSLITKLSEAKDENEVKQIFKGENIKPVDISWNTMNYKDWTNELLNTAEGMQNYLELEDTKQQSLKTLLNPSDAIFTATDDFVTLLEANLPADWLITPNWNVNWEALKDLKFKNNNVEYQIKYWETTNWDKKYIVFDAKVSKYFDTFKTSNPTAITDTLSWLDAQEKGLLKGKYILCQTSATDTNLIWKKINNDLSLSNL